MFTTYHRPHRFVGRILAIAVALLVLTAWAADSANASDGPTPKRCYEAYTYVKDLNAYPSTRCVVARTVMRHWYDRTACPADGDCRIRIGHLGTLWRCYGSRNYARLRPHYVSCWSGRDSRQGTWFTYTGSA